MSNLKNNFTSKLTSVVKTSSKKGFVYTASFEDGTQAVIRTSNREYASVTQISCNNHFALDRDSGTYSTVNRSDFLFSAKPTAALGKNEQGRVIACVQVQNPPAPQPVVAAPTIIDLKDLSLEQVSEMYRNGAISEALTEAYIELWNQGPHMTRAQLSDGVIRNYLAPEPVHEITKASATTAGFIEDAATGNVRGVIRQYGKVIWIEPKHSETRQEAVAKARAQLGDIAPEPVKGEKAFEHNGVAFTIAPDFKGTHGWRWYIEQPAVGRSIRSEFAYLCEERAIFEAKLQIDEQHRLKEQHRLEHSGDGDCDRHPLG